MSSPKAPVAAVVAVVVALYVFAGAAGRTLWWLIDFSGIFGG